MSIWPRSLFARLLLIMVLLLSLAQFVALAIHLQDRARVMHEVLGQQGAQRIADLVQLLDDQAGMERRRAIRAYRTPGLRVRLLRAVDAGFTAEDSAPARILTGYLRETLGAARELRVGLFEPGAAAPGSSPSRSAARHMHGPFNGPFASLDGGRGLRVEVRLLDGSWVRFDRLLPAELFNWPLRMLASLGLVLVVTVGVAYYAARRLTRPLSHLALAADTLGRDLHAAPLQEQGPTEVMQASQAFNRMQQRLRNFVDERTRMLAAISHDLKTPLTRIRLRVELVEDEQQRERLVHDLDDMEQMLKSSLAYARGAQAEAMESVDLGQLLDGLVADYTDAGRSVSTTELPVGLVLRVRPNAIKRCLANLVDNALRYAGSAEIDVSSAAGSVTIEILDRGPGIAPELLARVFEPFFRVEQSRSRDTGGSGLGLAIALDIARGHGGDLNIGNRVGGGLVARLSLPR